ncbi:TlpA family protein disulfide reductase [Nocardioides lacusdianchii]|uniref:TlpA family protein disulfide reductase n=1 Tax=Nocardioides lacusdianchii TaxID=2783664 RepID=UPI0013FAC9D2|nr:TlpA disulfide reductase family protein [Nocardioides lacusdianchii]MSW69199.1 redoxin domain-containing protein [Actinomycetota bacterium]
MSPRARRGVVLVGIVLVTALLTWLFVRALSVDDAGASGTSSDTPDLVQQYAPGERPSLAAFDVDMLDGSTLSDTDLRGTVTVLNVWGSWCGPCRAEAPELVEAVETLGKRAQFYGINVRDSADAARAFERAFDIPYPSVRAEDSGTAILAFRGVLTAAAVPSTVVVDADGGVAARVIGQVDASTLIGLVEDATTAD